MREIRFDVSDDELAILDGYCIGTGKSNTEIMRGLLAEWTKAKVHESIIVLRMARINPLEPESDR